MGFVPRRRLFLGRDLFIGFLVMGMAVEGIPWDSRCATSIDLVNVEIEGRTRRCLSAVPLPEVDVYRAARSACVEISLG